MKYPRRRLLRFRALPFFAAPVSALYAQVLLGSLTGLVSDSTGAVVPNAKVVAVNTATGFKRETTTNADGIYTFGDLQPGSYTVTISGEGFAPFEQQNTPISANGRARVNGVLTTGSVNQQVTVSSAPPVLQTDRADTSYNISQEQLTELPTTSSTGRNFQSLYKLVPGSTPPSEQNSQASNPQRAQAVNVNGLSGTANATRIDGAVDQYPYLPLNIAYVPPQDAIDTVNVVTSSFNAEQGSAGGAAINVVMKSGTNKFHGSVFEYNTITQFNARNYFFRPTAINPTPQKYIFNQYGLSVGGPLIKDKLFFFADWESTHISNAVNGIASVPTAALRAGDFSGAVDRDGKPIQIYNPATGDSETGAGKTTFANNQVPVSKAAATLLENLPLPNYGGVGAQTNNYFGSTNNTFKRDDIDFKMNYNPTGATSFFGHYSASPDTIRDPQQFGLIPGGGTWDGGQPGTATGLLQNVGLNMTHVFTPNVLLDANAGYTRQRVGANSDDLSLGDYGTDVLGIPGTNNNGQYLYGGIPAMTISASSSVNGSSSGYTGLGNTNSGSPFLFRDNQYTGNVNLSYNHGTHAFRFGGEYVHAAINHFQPGGIARGQFNFTGGATTQSGGNATTYNALADFLRGTASSVSKGVQTDNPLTLRYSQFAFYGQDTWQASSNLTLSYGLRYEYYPLPVRAHSGLYNYNPAVRSTVTDSYGTHTVGTVILGGNGGNSNSAGIKNGWGMIVPRFGVSYRTDSKTVIRGGFGITIDPENLRNQLNAYPANVNLTVNAANNYTVARTFTNGIPNLPIPDLTASTLPLPADVSTQVMPQNFRRGYIESFNLSIQHQLPASLVANVAYVGTHAIRQQSNVNINAAPIGGSTAGRLLNATYGVNTNNTDLNESLPFRGSVYNGLQAQLTRTGTKFGSTGLVYTFSKAMDIADNSTNSGLTFAYPAYWDKNWALAGYDRKHNFQWWTVLPSPFGKNGAFLKSGFAGAVLGGWQLQTILSWYSGTPFTVSASASSLNAPGNSQVADRVGTVKILGAHNRDSLGKILYFDPSNFAQPNGARFGNSGRNSVRGPGFFNIDTGLKREIPLFEKVALQLQIEAFNTTNTPKFANPTADASNPSNGQITSTASGGDNRRLRLSGRITF